MSRDWAVFWNIFFIILLFNIFFSCFHPVIVYLQLLVLSHCIASFLFLLPSLLLVIKCDKDITPKPCSTHTLRAPTVPFAFPRNPTLHPTRQRPRPRHPGFSHGIQREHLLTQGFGWRSQRPTSQGAGYRAGPEWESKALRWLFTVKPPETRSSGFPRQILDSSQPHGDRTGPKSNGSGCCGLGPWQTWDWAPGFTHQKSRRRSFVLEGRKCPAGACAVHFLSPAWSRRAFGPEPVLHTRHSGLLDWWRKPDSL